MKLEEALKMERFASPQQKAMLEIIYTANWLLSSMASMLKPFGVSEQQFNVLRILRGSHPRPMNMQDIQGRMLTPTSNATRLVEKLRLKGYVERNLCEQNRRKVEIEITDEGLRFLERLDVELKAQQSVIQEQLTEADAEKISALLEHMRRSQKE